MAKMSKEEYTKWYASLTNEERSEYKQKRLKKRRSHVSARRKKKAQEGKGLPANNTKPKSVSKPKKPVKYNVFNGQYVAGQGVREKEHASHTPKPKVKYVTGNRKPDAVVIDRAVNGGNRNTDVVVIDDGVLKTKPRNTSPSKFVPDNSNQKKYKRRKAAATAKTLLGKDAEERRLNKDAAKRSLNAEMCSVRAEKVVFFLSRFNEQLTKALSNPDLKKGWEHQEKLKAFRERQKEYMAYITPILAAKRQRKAERLASLDKAA